MAIGKLILAVINCTSTSVIILPTNTFEYGQWCSASTSATTSCYFPLKEKKRKEVRNVTRLKIPSNKETVFLISNQSP